ncbi:hypothetical protein EV356DRAFT_495684 [Viridothelium virens]|uniref:Uncharacterized protein n=1 Tax=Viridothelium virens TaxID=1048519 RepID=A0A6A6HR05_VIRVR|nr:hypothetical protein EV356DRAFT_495684 [Viridothelium virens]
MANQKYSPEFLRALRQSPLVSKPHGLPSIEQWMDTASTVEANQRRARPPGTRPDELLLNTDKQTQRPSLMQTRSSARVTSGSAGDTFLGPPKTAFASASRIATKPLDSPNQPTNGQDDDPATHNRSDTDSRSFRTRQTEAPGSLTNGRRFGREDGDGWTNVRNRKGSTGHEDTERMNRGDLIRDRPFGRGDRDRHANEPERRPGRGGVGRGRHESGSWRTPPASAGLDVDWEMPLRHGMNDKDRRTNRDFRNEQEPEWLDEPAASFESTTKHDSKSHTAEDFQRWKAQMKGNKAETEKKTEESNKTPTSAKASKPASKPTTPLAVDEELGKLSGWGSTKTTEAKSEGIKSASGPVKESRFKSFFSPRDQPSHIEASSQAENTTATATNDKDPDKEGFNLIMQKLLAQNLQSSSQSDNTSIQSNPLGTLFGNMNESKEQSYGQKKQYDEKRDPRQSGFDPWSPLSQRPSSGLVPPPQVEQSSRTPQCESAFQDFSTRTAPRNQQDEQQALADARRDLLLSLMKAHPNVGVEAPPAFADHHSPDDPDFQIFINDEPPQQPAPRSSRGPPSGFFDERFANDFDRQQQQQQPKQHQQPPLDYEQEMLGRRPSHPQRGPNNFFDDPAISNYQRRNQIPEPEQRFTGNPIGPGSNLPFFDGPFQGGAIPLAQQHQQQQHSSQTQTPQQRHDVGPPPGFNLPPFRNPQPQPPPLSAGFPPGFSPNQGNFNMNRNIPPMDGHQGNRGMALPPPGGGPNGPPPHMFPGGGPPGAPPGFFNNGPPSAPPPGFPGFPGGPQGFGPDGLSVGRGTGIHGGLGGQQGNGRGQPFGMDGRMFR